MYIVQLKFSGLQLRPIIEINQGLKKAGTPLRGPEI